jgi:hypothetical protein
MVKLGWEFQKWKWPVVDRLLFDSRSVALAGGTHD